MTQEKRMRYTIGEVLEEIGQKQFLLWLWTQTQTVPRSAHAREVIVREWIKYQREQDRKTVRAIIREREGK